MSALIKLEEHENSNEVHVSGVKLESDRGRADMITARHDSLHDESRAHGIVEPSLVRNSVKVGIKLLACGRQGFEVSSFQEDETVEKQTKDNVAKVAKEMIEISHFSERFLAKMVVVTEVMVACLIILCVGVQHHLHGGEGVVHTDDDQHHPVQV